MARNIAPAFQFYPRDTLANPEVAAMSLEEFGAYWRLICYIWLEGFLPYDETKLAKMLNVTPKKFKRLWPTMGKLFRVKDGKITSPELDEQRQKQKEWREKSRVGGLRSGETRRKRGSNMVQTNWEPAMNTSSSSSSLSSSLSSTASPLPNKGGEGGDHRSRFSLADRKQYCASQDVGRGWLVKSADGGFDDAIEDWIESGRPNERRQGLGELLEDEESNSE